MGNNNARWGLFRKIDRKDWRSERRRQATTGGTEERLEPIRKPRLLRSAASVPGFGRRHEIGARRPNRADSANFAPASSPGTLSLDLATARFSDRFSAPLYQAGALSGLVPDRHVVDRSYGSRFFPATTRGRATFRARRTHRFFEQALQYSGPWSAGFRHARCVVKRTEYQAEHRRGKSAKEGTNS